MPLPTHFHLFHPPPNRTSSTSTSTITITPFFFISSSSSSSSSKFKFKLLLLLLIFMSTSFFLLYSLLFLSLSPSPSSATRHSHSRTRLSATPTPIQLACRATRYPTACQSSLSAVAGDVSTPTAVVQAAFIVSKANLKTGQGMVEGILSESARDQNRSRAAQNCLELLSMSDHRTTSAVDGLTRGKLRDARAWASAALSYQNDCWSALKYVNNSASVNSTMSYFDTTVIVATSNALSMLGALDALGPDTASWTPPRTERDGFWEPVLGSGDAGGGGPNFEFTGMKVDATVDKSGSNGCYKSVQEAIDAAPENLKGGDRFVIRIKEGVYQEIVRVGFNKTNLVFLGDGIGKSVISGSLNTGVLGITTYNTATVGIAGDGFMASGLTFENAAGPDAHQAVAFRSDSDFSYIENCEFLGNQDTLYVHSLRQLYKSCRILGNVDFIFGNAAAIFQNCTILVRPRQLKPESGETNAIAACGRTDPAQTTGFSFLGCLINGTDEYMKYYLSKPSKHKNYLGRPWKMYSRTVYINCNIESLLAPEGWLPWSGDFALATLYYGEFGNSGPGSNVSKRVPWSKVIPEAHVSTYYVQNFLQGDEWITTAS